MKLYIYAAATALILSVISGFFVVPLLRKIKIGQPVLKYVETHKDKNGTPTMGGLFFITSAIVAFIIFGGAQGKTALVALTVGASYLLVGFLDDFIKVKYKKNEGLKAYQKILFQTAIAAFAGIFCYSNGLTRFFIPFTEEVIDLKIWTVPISAFIFIAITNGVNLTDGLDSLAGGTSSAYLFFIGVIILLEMNSVKNNIFTQSEYEKLLLLTFSLDGAIAGFLVFNVSRAKVFMGDSGSLSLGGFIGVISIFSGNSFFIPVIGIMFVVSCISVIVQVAWYKRTKKRVFLMAPLHHHFQMKGYTETQVSYVYFIITCFFGAISVAAFL